MSDTTTSNADRAETAPAPKKSSPVRLAILLVILGVLFVGLMVDMFVMHDSVNAAVKRLSDAHTQVASRSVNAEEGQNNYLDRAGVKEAIGFAPTTSEVQDGRLVEHYRWWGALPLKRRYIVVFYDDTEGNRYSGCEVANGSEEEEKFEVAPAPAAADATGENPAPAIAPPGERGAEDAAKSEEPATPEAASETPSSDAKEDADKT